MNEKIAWFIEINKKRTSLQVGDVVFGHTGLKTDVYKENDSQVISGKRKVGETKQRPGLCLDIFNQKEIAVIWSSHSGKKIFFAKSKNANSEYHFRSNLLQLISLDEKNKVLTKGWNGQQLPDSELTVEEITASQYYSKFLERTEKLKKVDPGLEM